MSKIGRWSYWTSQFPKSLHYFLDPTTGGDQFSSKVHWKNKYVNHICYILWLSIKYRAQPRILFYTMNNYVRVRTQIQTLSELI